MISLICKMKISLFLCYYFLFGILLLTFEVCAFGNYGSTSSNLKNYSKDIFEKYESHEPDFLIEDDHGEFELADIMNLSQLDVSKDTDAYSPFEKKEFVDIHNIYRSNLTKPIPKGSDLQYVEWNSDLAWDANNWLKKCILERGYDKHENMSYIPGQNLYKGPSELPSRPLYLWYEEYKHFSFENFTCTSPYICNHMTQMLWSDSSKIGCARKSNCWPRISYDTVVSCHYFHAGNKWTIGTQMYKYGWQCTRCELPDGNLCFKGLCVDKRMCNAYKLDCECKVDCKNCAKPNHKKCRCEPCKPGWDWRDCSFPCIDYYDTHEKKQGFCRWKIQNEAKKLCNFSEVSNMCRRSCGNCKALNSSDTENLCCGGKMCAPYHVLDEKCNCKKDCPSNICLYPTSTTKYPFSIPQPSGTSNNIVSNSTQSTQNTFLRKSKNSTQNKFPKKSKNSTQKPQNETSIPPIEIVKKSEGHRNLTVCLVLILIALMLLLLK